MIQNFLNYLVDHQTLLEPSQYRSSSSSSVSDETAGMIVVMLFVIPIILTVIVGIIANIGLYKVLKKTGRPGWPAFVPVYNSMMIAEISGYPSWWGLGYLISPINIVVALIFGMSLAKRFGKSDMFGIVALGFFSVIGYWIIAFDKSVYNESATPNKNTLF